MSGPVHYLISHVRDLNATPPPQVRLQDDQGLHSDHRDDEEGTAKET